MRIASLVPHATELLFALGAGDDVVAVTHECDYPPEAAELPFLTRNVLPPHLTAAEIDAAVRERTLAGEAIYELDEHALVASEPDLIVTQALCPVCAVPYDDVLSIAEQIPWQPRVVSLDPKTLGETLSDIRTLATATDRKDQGVEIVRRTADRIDRLKLAVRGAPRPRVAALEWLDPLFIAGHWTPQMIDLAGGEDVLGLPGEPSQQLSWDDLAAAHPEIVVIMPCGYDAPHSADQAHQQLERLSSLSARRIVAVDASSYFSRPGPRLIDGIELLAHILHPDLFPDAPAQAIEIDLSC